MIMMFGVGDRDSVCVCVVAGDEIDIFIYVCMIRWKQRWCEAVVCSNYGRARWGEMKNLTKIWRRDFRGEKF